MMTLGIPGDAVTAVLIGALIIHGLRPGPMLMREQPEFFWILVGALFLSNIFLYIFRHDRHSHVQQDCGNPQGDYYPDHRCANHDWRLFDSKPVLPIFIG